MIQAVIWDADGTLLDSMGIWEEALSGCLARRGKVLDRESVRVLFSMTPAQGSNYIKEKFSLSDPAEVLLSEILVRVGEFYRLEAQAKPGVREFLEGFYALHIPMAVASAGDRTLLEPALERLGIRRYFERILICAEQNTDKKSPLIYQTAARFLGGVPENTLVFEDALFALRTAKRAGFRVVGVADAAGGENQTLLRSEAEFYIERYADFPGFLQTVKQSF